MRIFYCNFCRVVGPLESSRCLLLSTLSCSFCLHVCVSFPLAALFLFLWASFFCWVLGLGLLHFLSHFLHKFSQFQKLSENPPLSSNNNNNNDDNNNNKFVTSQKSWWVNTWVNHISKVSQITFSSCVFLR